MPSIEGLKWDSDFFGLPIGIARIPCLSGETAGRIHELAYREGFGCVYVLAESDSPEGLRAALTHGFVQVDTRLEMERGLGCCGNPILPPTLRHATEADIPQLRTLAGRSHRDSRFHYDLRFPDDRCDELYEGWIESSLSTEGRTVLVSTPDDDHATVNGYCAFTDCDEHGASHISLIAVSPDAQGSGVGSALVNAALASMATAGALTAEVPTQARNVAAQRLYQHHGFLTRKVRLWYHLWIADPHIDAQMNTHADPSVLSTPSEAP